MLKNIHPSLGPDLLYALRTMGHGDEIVIGDANFPASTLGPEVIRADGMTATGIAEAILAHMPLDTFMDQSAWRMEVVGDPNAMPEICGEFQTLVTELAGNFKVEALERFAFYEKAKTAAYIVATTEFRLYGCLILKKGVLEADALYRVR